MKSNIKKESPAKTVLKNSCNVGLLLNQDKNESKNKQEKQISGQNRAEKINK